MPEFDLEGTGFDMGEIDVILEPAEVIEGNPEAPVADGPAIARRGDIFQLGPHRIGCGDATDGDFYRELMAGAVAAAVFSEGSAFKYRHASGAYPFFLRSTVHTSPKITNRMSGITATAWKDCAAASASTALSWGPGCSAANAASPPAFLSLAAS